MKLVVKKTWNSGDQVGAVKMGSCLGHIETPLFSLLLVKGFVNLSLLTYSLLSLPLILISFKFLHSTCNLEGLASTTISKIGGLHQMLGLHQYGIVVVVKDSIQCLRESKGATKLGATFETPCGRLLIKPKDYVEIISCMRLNIWVTLAYEVPAWVFNKRNKTSIERTVRWLDDCVALNPIKDNL
ncbi:hypothetical protein CR513_18782, partial [Mucuna pruriens]